MGPKEKSPVGGAQASIPNQPTTPAFDTELKELWNWNLTNHTPTPEAIQRMEALRSAAKAMSSAIIDLAPHSRERSLALTHLEETLFYVNAAIARNNTADSQESSAADKTDKPGDTAQKEGK